MEKKSINQNQTKPTATGKRQLKQIQITTQGQPYNITKIQSDITIKNSKKSSDWIVNSGYDSQKQVDLRNAECILIHSLGIPSVLRHSVNDKLRNALANGNINVNITAFTVIKNRYSEYDKVKMGGEYYEKLLNDFTSQRITKKDLSSDLINFEKRYCELLQICNYLEQMRHPLDYIIYKREIELVDTTPIHNESDFLDKYFMPKRVGFYYAIIVNFGLSYSRIKTCLSPSKTNEIGVNIGSISKSSSSSSTS